ncbi:MAG: hypothetical protein V3T05_10345 [Myxococcota bacterium]
MFRRRAAKLGPVACDDEIVRSRTMHPNQVGLLEEMVRKVGDLASGDEPDDWQRLLADLPQLTSGEQTTVLAVLAVAVVIDGYRPTRAQASGDGARGMRPELRPTALALLVSPVCGR